jgi:ABC-2 type transport system permease protein
MSAEAPPAAGVIHDLGYRRYDGPRLGRLQVIRALYWHSLRSSFGIGRGAKAKIIPIIAFIIICLPAIVSAISIDRGGQRLYPYDTYLFPVRVLVMTIFIAAQAPELVSRDLRSHVLPLYFARQMRRLDYPIAKIAAFITACLVMLEVPLVILYVGTIAQEKGIHAGHNIWLETRAFIPGLLVGLMWAILLATVSLFLASLTGRRAYATGMIAIYFFFSWVLAQLIFKVVRQTAVAHAINAQTSGTATRVAPSGRILTFVPTNGQRLPGLLSPFTTLDGVRQWLGGTSPGPLAPPGNFGVLYGLVFLVLLAASLGGLAARYRKAGLS